MNIPRQTVARVILFVLALAVLGCSRRAEVNVSLPSDITTAVEIAFAENNPQAVAAMYSDDAELLAPNTPVIRGRENIDAFFRDTVRWILSYDLMTVDSQVFGDYAYHYATYTYRNVRRGENIEHGKQIDIWRRRDDVWKIYRSSWSSDDPPLAPTVEAVEPAKEGGK